MHTVATQANTEPLPVLGLGTWKLHGEACIDAVRYALELGLTHIDTARAYENHHEVGRALKGFQRERLFLTSKIMPEDLSKTRAITAVERSLIELETEYLDLILIHWPDSSFDMRHTFDAFAELAAAGKIRYAGVSNFTRAHLERLNGTTSIAITNNQVEFHPFLFQKQLRDYCLEHDISLTAYCPLARGAVLKNDILRRLASEKNCSAAAVSLVWLRQLGLVAIPKASSRDHIKANVDSLGISLSVSEMAEIESLDRGQRLVAPDWAEFEL